MCYTEVFLTKSGWKRVDVIIQFSLGKRGSYVVQVSQ